MEVKPGYKQTEVGLIPMDWSVTPLGRLVRSIEYGSSAKSSPRGRIPVLRMGNLQRGKIDWNDLVYTDDASEISKYALSPGEVLFNRTNTVDLVGKTAIYEGERPAIFAGYLIRVKVAPELLDSRYLNYVLNTEFSRNYSAKVLSVAVGQANINGQKLKEYPIPLPPTRPEQTTIAAALGDVDALIASLDRLIAKKRDIKQAAMQQLLTGRTRLPGFSGAWERKRFGDIFQFLNTANNPRSDLGEFGEVGYIHYGDIHTQPSAFLDCAIVPIPLIDQALVKGIPFIEDGDLVMVDASEDYIGIGKCVEINNVGERKIVAGLHTFVLRGEREQLANGFKGYLQFLPAVRSALIRLATGISVYGVSKGNVKSIDVYLPSAKEQTAIAEVLSNMDAEITALEKRREKTRLIKQGMMQELLTGRTRLNG